MHRTPNTQDSPGAAVRRLRRERGVTQEALAFEANVTIATLSRIERGVSSPQWATAQAISTALGITLQELARAVEEPQVHPPTAPGGGE
jgi:transcriptional regulator with XRE-family HTH domain